jgi:hypothetical protein
MVVTGAITLVEAPLVTGKVGKVEPKVVKLVVGSTTLVEVAAGAAKVVSKAVYDAGSGLAMGALA